MKISRTIKFSKQIQKDLYEIFQKDVIYYFGNNLVTITGVEVFVDLSVAKVFLSVFPIANSQNVLENLRSKKNEIRKKLGNRIAKQVRIVPDLIFYIDDTENKAEKIDKLIDKLNIPPHDDEGISN